MAHIEYDVLLGWSCFVVYTPCTFDGVPKANTTAINTNTHTNINTNVGTNTNTGTTVNNTTNIPPTPNNNN